MIPELFSVENNNQIIKQISKKYFVSSVIILFGSRARKDNDYDSDYDILIITDDELSNEKKRFLKAKIRQELAQKKIPADILIQNQSEIESRKKICGHIVNQALKEGIEI